MADYACIIQEGQAADGLRAELADGLKRIGRELLGDAPDDTEIRWIAIREGFGFTAARPSTTSLVARSVPPGWPDDEREAFMRRVCALWEEVTGCTTDEIVVTTLEGALPL